MDKPQTLNQGRVFVEYDYTDKYYFICMPDGEVWVSKTRKEAIKYIKQWCKKHADDTKVNFATIEWRDCPTKKRGPI